MAIDKPSHPPASDSRPPDLPAPGDSLDPATMPAHWLLARLGKTVMRPGGLPVTRAMLEGLAVGPADDVVDLAPGLGVTVGLVAAARPASFRGVERGGVEAERARRLAGSSPYTCVVAEPERTGLPGGSASVVYGEAVLSLETDETKRAIIAEAARLLRPGGRLGLHELLLRPADLPEEFKARLQRELTTTLRVRARPLTVPEWRRMLDEGGFDVLGEHSAPLLLLSTPTFIRDEGVAGTARFLARVLRRPAVAKRLVAIWRLFHRYRAHLGAVSLVARKR
jgi:SAM-dependent methyltransferase